MPTLKLTAENQTEQLIVDFLAKNVSDVLAEKINAGQKTVAGAMRYAKQQAQELAKDKTYAMVEDAVVFGWIIHFFEEDSIPENEPKPTYKAPSGCKTRHAVKPKAQQLDLFSQLIAEGAK